MPVSTDAVILGAWAPLTKALNVLDIGAGSGLLSLMAAQRSQAFVTAIELDDTAAKACESNFQASKWVDRLSVEHGSVQEFSQSYLSSKQTLFDHIICNPPYFKGGTQSKNALRAKARHTDTLDFSCLIKSITQMLSPNGSASLILPSQSMQAFNAALDTSTLANSQIMDISDRASKAPHRHVFTLVHKLESTSAPDASTATEHLCIKLEDGSYTPEMIALITDFYLKY